MTGPSDTGVLNLNWRVTGTAQESTHIENGLVSGMSALQMSCQGALKPDPQRETQTFV